MYCNCRRYGNSYDGMTHRDRELSVDCWNIPGSDMFVTLVFVVVRLERNRVARQSASKQRYTRITWLVLFAHMDFRPCCEDESKERRSEIIIFSAPKTTALNNL